MAHPAAIVVAILQDGFWTTRKVPAANVKGLLGFPMKPVSLPAPDAMLFQGSMDTPGLPPAGILVDPQSGACMEALTGPILALGPDGTSVTKTTLATLERHVMPVVVLSDACPDLVLQVAEVPA